MKKKQIYALLTATVLMATSITGCSSKATEETAVEETTEADAEEVSEEEPEAVEEPVYETRQYTVEVAAANEDGTFKAYDADGKEYLLTFADDLSDDEKALVVPEACLIVSTEVQVGTKLVVNGEEVSNTEENSEETADEATTTEEKSEDEADAELKNEKNTDVEENSEDENSTTEETEKAADAETTTEESPIAVTVTAVAVLEDEAQAATLATVTFKAVNGFSVEDLAEATMYAKQTVNVRKGPSADYEQLGSLSSGQEVTVTGIADTGWYRINYNDETGYCSNNYLQTEKPAPKAAASNSGSSNDESAATSETQVAQADTGSAAADTGSNAAASSGRDFKAEYDAAMRAGNIDLAKQILEESSGVKMNPGVVGGSGSGSSSSSNGSSSSSSEERSVATSADFVNYLNQKRAEAGLGELSWSDSMASTAAERASEIADNFSHSGKRDCTSEIILYRNSGSVSDWYNQFYDSSAHRASMLSEAWGSAAAAYCKSGNTYYVVVMFDY